MSGTSWFHSATTPDYTFEAHPLELEAQSLELQAEQLLHKDKDRPLPFEALEAHSLHLEDEDLQDLETLEAQPHPLHLEAQPLRLQAHPLHLEAQPLRLQAHPLRYRYNQIKLLKGSILLEPKLCD